MDNEKDIEHKNEVKVIRAIIKYIVIALLIFMLGYAIKSNLDAEKIAPLEYKQEVDKNIAGDDVDEPNKEVNLPTEEELKQLNKEVEKDRKNREKMERENERLHVLKDRRDFNKYIAENENLLLEFRVHWCPYCDELESRFTEILAEKEDLVILQIDMDEHRDLTDFYQAVATPTLVMYKNGEPFDRVSGALPTDMLMDWMDGKLDIGK